MRTICSEGRGAGKHHLHLLLLHPLVKYPVHKPQPTAAKRPGLQQTCSESTEESYPEKKEKLAQLQLPPASLQGKWHFAGARIWGLFLQTGLQNRWGFLMCLITELVQVGKRDFSASLPSSILLTTSCPRLSVTPQQTTSPALLIRTLLKLQPGRTLCHLPLLGSEQWFSACHLQVSGSPWTSMQESLKDDRNSCYTDETSWRVCSSREKQWAPARQGQKTLVSLPCHMGGRGDFCLVCWQNAQSLGYQSILFSNCWTQSY